VLGDAPPTHDPLARHGSGAARGIYPCSVEGWPRLGSYLTHYPRLLVAMAGVGVGHLLARRRLESGRRALLRRLHADHVEHRGPGPHANHVEITIFTVFYVLTRIGILVGVARQIGVGFVEARSDHTATKQRAAPEGRSARDPVGGITAWRAATGSSPVVRSTRHLRSSRRAWRARPGPGPMGASRRRCCKSWPRSTAPA
jgi:hypothetical protein